MRAFISVTGRAAPLPSANIDTDVIMPKQFLKGVDRKGLDRGAFFDLRFNSAGQKNRDFVLNRPEWHDARFLIVGSNFGCGSSREHAVWGLSQLGIRAIIGTSFSGIFDDNCQRNGLLTITLNPDIVDRLLVCAAKPATNVLTISLQDQRITVDSTGEQVTFAIDGSRKDGLMRGLDPIDATLELAADIRVFEAKHFEISPWLDCRSQKTR
ncbi:3-isopropylmalate dehydratase small subunit [Pararhizobium sp. DWP3-4]|uniref:3-isopropylmalate dehydratase small subunit n=1 Tax=Pararhizobium sp. DWP3-4 TaxID=2804565 RepID=UPI003CEE6185